MNPKNAVSMAKKLLKRKSTKIEEIRFYDLDHSSKEEKFVAGLREELSSLLLKLQNAISEDLGPPSRSGSGDDDLLPFHGVFQFAIWEIDGKLLYLTAVQEDTGEPLIMFMGTI